MKPCKDCGSPLPAGAKVCPKCGAVVVASTPEPAPEPIEDMRFEGIIISEKGFTFRLRNTGNLPLTVQKIEFSGHPTEIVDITPPPADQKESKGLINPGDAKEVTFKMSFTGMAGISYMATVVTGSGKRYQTTVGAP